VPVPVVDLPLGATEDRVVGALDLERALTAGEKVFEPGLLARLAQAGEQRARQRFSVTAAAEELEKLFEQAISKKVSSQIPSITAACRGRVLF
jgi:hypothetical protein